MKQINIDNLTQYNIDELYDFYQHCSDEYYNKGETLISDDEFDLLEEYLLEYGSEQIKSDIENKIMTSEGELQDAAGLMVSLKKIKYKDQSSISDILKFFNYKNLDFYVAPKYDGNAIRIIKDSDVSIQTRGGMDVTSKLINNKRISNLIEKLPYITTGELVINKKIFNEKYSEDYENARNIVGGFITKKDEDENVDVNDFVFIPCTDGTNHIDQIFDVGGYKHQWIKMSRSQLYSMPQLIERFKSDKFPFMCDGIVISTHTDKREIKNNYPLNMVAVKFPAPSTESKVIGFEWSQKKSGKLTPILLIEPTELEGSTITRINGVNYSYIKNGHIGIGAIVQFSKSGDIIPIVNKVIKRSKEIVFPDVEYYIKGKHIYAVDEQRSVEYKFYLGFRRLNIEGIGPENANIVGEVCDYDIVKMFDKTLKPDFIEKLGIDSAIWKKFSSIYDIKTLYLDDLVFMLQFDGVGQVNSKKVADIITKKSVDTKGISNDVLSNVCSGEGFKKIKESLNILHKYGVKVIQRSENASYMSFEMSGDPPGMTKKQFIELMKQKYPNSEHRTLNRETNYLIVNDMSSNTSKANKARRYRIPMYTYQQIIENKVTLK